MSALDWTVLLGTLFFIVAYGVWKTRGSNDIEGYLLGNKQMKWGTIGLSVMATQASAITFLSTPGQAYASGMGFVQNYLGLPIALIIVSAVFIPIYFKQKVYTAYEYLEGRFDLKTRLLGGFLFLVQRGLAAGITIYAPAIILSTMLGWNLEATILTVGILVVIYTVSGGTKAVSLTQKYQMAVIMGGMLIAFFVVLGHLPETLSFSDAVKVAGKMGKLEVISFSMDPGKRYTFWTGIGGGLFLAMSYFGTDQSQVARYLSGKSIAESRMGLMFNALLKIPMQFFILFLGVMVFVFYLFEQPPTYFKQVDIDLLQSGIHAEAYSTLEKAHTEGFKHQKEDIIALVDAFDKGDENDINAKAGQLKQSSGQYMQVREDIKTLISENDPQTETKDSDYVFLTFIMNFMPKGLIGLLLAVIFSAAMSSTSSELNALASTTTVDFYKRVWMKGRSDKHYLIASKLLTLFWGVVAIIFALYARLVENLIEAVNILGSIFYGTVLGIFLVAFFIKQVKGNAVFFGALVAQLLVLLIKYNSDISYLWFNIIGCVLTIVFSFFLQLIIPHKAEDSSTDS